MTRHVATYYTFHLGPLINVDRVNCSWSPATHHFKCMVGKSCHYLSKVSDLLWFSPTATIWPSMLKVVLNSKHTIPILVQPPPWFSGMSLTFQGEDQRFRKHCHMDWFKDGRLLSIGASVANMIRAPCIDHRHHTTEWKYTWLSPSVNFWRGLVSSKPIYHQLGKPRSLSSLTFIIRTLGGQSIQKLKCPLRCLVSSLSNLPHDFFLLTNQKRRNGDWLER